jgi:hypothetical protein
LARLFNAYVIVDWSAASKPTTGADSVWIGVLKRDVRFRFSFESHNPPTRKAAEILLGQILDDRARHRDRVLLGFDFALGFSRGLAGGLKLKGDQPWRAIWNDLDRLVADKADNTNNRFSVASNINRRLTGEPFPFWGCPANQAQTTLQATRLRAHGPADIPEFRHAELAAKGAASVWKLYYNGSVGGQTIMGIPVARRLRDARGERARVWPFETGFRTLSEADLDGVEVLIAEVYPSLVKAQPAAGEAKDLAQVRTLCEHLARQDEQGKLAAMFGPPEGLGADALLDAAHEEGWILGA